ncbi:DUF4349 domain-containing protein [uncultured Fluviicola sp.]|uniref:DUF4349 domain-containing protein n=1 Tax=uncultured Fluviicola sp. TaxID=463303 RepID=UPI0025CF3250|nr:DUF4349 domain-containing protein [uncultured Fluviicola sp.]
MKRTINPYLFIGLFSIPVLVFSCSQNGESKSPVNLESSYSGKDSEQSAGLRSSAAYKEEKDHTTQSKKKLIKTGNLTIESKHIEKSKSNLDVALKSLDGYYDNEQFSKSDYEFRYSLTVRVPAKNFDRILQVIHHGDDEIISKNIKTRDVSTEYVDIETRLKSKRAYLQRYEDFLSRAKSMDELLQIQEKIRALIEEIESQEGRLQFLDDQVGYSTLDIELYKTISRPDSTTEEPGFWENAKKSIANGWSGVVVLFLGLLSIWPLLLILVPAGIYGYRKLKNPKKSN